MVVTDMFLEDYDAAAEDVIRANYRNYPETLQRWFYVLDNGTASAEIVANLENAVDFQKSYVDETTNARATRRGEPHWPLALAERLGIQRYSARLENGKSTLLRLATIFFAEKEIISTLSS